MKDQTDFLKQWTQEAQDALVETLNAAATNLRTKAIDAIFARYNMERIYIAQHISVRKRANRNNPQVTVSARVRTTQLVRFSARQEWRPGKTVDQRHDGISVNVVRGNPREKFDNAFFIKLKRGQEGFGNFGMATRAGPGRDNYKVRYSVSVSQAFSWFREDLAPGSEELFDMFIERFNPL